MNIKDLDFSGFERYDFGRDRKPSNTPTNPNDPVEARIRMLIDSAEPYDRESLIYAFPQLVTAAKDTKSAKRDWLSRLYEKRGWIDSDTATQLRDRDGDSALSELEAVCLQKANLRPKGSIVPRYRLPSAGEELGDYVRQTLEENGINPEGLSVRYLWKPERVGTAVMTGCDRDFGSISHVNHHGRYDGEELAMIRHGITSAADTAYLGDLKNWRNADKQDRFAVLVYSPDAVEGIGPLGYVKSNGFHAFHFGGEVKRRSLLAVFE